MIQNARGRRSAFFIPILLSLVIHMLIFIGVSLDLLWPKGVSAKKPLPVRIVSVQQPPRDKYLPPNPNSRLLSDANRRESGAGKPSTNPRLRREKEDRIPAQRGTSNPQIASLPPPPSPPVLAQPVPSPPVVPEPVTPEPVTPEPKVQEKPTPSPKEVEKPRPKPDTQKKAEPAPSPPSKKEVKPSPPKSVEKARPAPAVEKSAPAKTPAKKQVKKPDEKPKPQIKVTRKADRPKRLKQVKKKVEKPKKKKTLEVASLPKTQKKVQPTRPKKAKPTPPKKKSVPKPPKDVLAMFRAQPTPKGRPDAPPLSLSNEDADQIALANLRKKMEAEEGEVLSLNTRDVRFQAYFAYLRRVIERAWDPRVSKYPGKVKLKFVLREDGSLRRVELLGSSGYRILDDAALSAVSEPAPFKPLPPSLAKRKFVPIRAEFNYDIR